MHMLERFGELENTIKEQCGRHPVYYFPNPGNWGDGLIRQGTLWFFKDIKLNYRELSQKEYLAIVSRKRNWLSNFSRKNTFIYGGGGGWCKLWNHSANYISALKQQFNVIVLPSTYETSYTIPGSIFYCRDTFESKQNMPQALFCHDMAFYIGKRFIQKRQGKETGFFFRTDPESSGNHTIPSCNIDISKKGNHLSTIAAFFDEINSFKVIHTDRLHVAIAACLLEKNVHMYLGSYFKNRAVYMSSMRGYFDNVSFHEDFHS